LDPLHKETSQKFFKGYCAEILSVRMALLDRDLHCAQGSMIRRSSLDAELDCVGGPQKPHLVHGIIGWRPALCAELALWGDPHPVQSAIM